MKKVLILFTIIMFGSCNSLDYNNEAVISGNPFLIGNWSGEGVFYDVDFNKQVGSVFIEIEIKDNFEISGKIGDSNISNIEISEASFGFEIKGVLDSQMKLGLENNKDHLLILLVFPEKEMEFATFSEANFHLKTNYILDLSMRVGGVKLLKK